ncbi:MAG: four helix bundle protein [Candidatus Brocadiae bacterium]|nr:four helix bundle protein [Candidatus Brocadiia bacterium]
MVTFKSFEEIEGWQKARELTRAVYAVSAEGGFAKDFGLRDQVRRASVSIMANIAEGFDRSGTGEFAQFLAIAKASAAEVRSHLYVALDQRYITEQAFNEMTDLAAETGRIIGGLMRYLRETDIKGTKFR